MPLWLSTEVTHSVSGVIPLAAMEDDVLCDMERLISQTANPHYFDDPLELEYCDDEHDASSLLLVAAKILSIKPSSLNFVKSVLAQMWGIPKGLKVTELERNKFSIVFPSALDKKHIMNKGPWSINRELIVLKDVPLSLTIREVNLSSTLFWVRITGLSRDSISESHIRFIAAKIGRLVEIDPKSLGIFFAGDLVRVKDFCFKYRVLGHDHRICSAMEGVMISNGITRVALYGAWLRAENDVLSCFHSNRSNMEQRPAAFLEPNRDQELLLISRNRQSAWRGRLAPNDWRLEGKKIISSPGASQMVQAASSGLSDQRGLCVTSSTLA
ncbi:hypothetical protein TorRG33x02_185930 [Trema orientale]|uniref:DUF4283 domain-containing protein n=1 Tax=Trema orientale TaxID=63057 RepID=A0A2P5EJ62_TREOI|nr:hypothetical protein TorRG33x02_185930 [Trema orientale]